MANCAKCGAILSGSDKFCGECGEPVPKASLALDLSGNGNKNDSSSLEKPRRGISLEKSEDSPQLGGHQTRLDLDASALPLSLKSEESVAAVAPAALTNRDLSSLPESQRSPLDLDSARSNVTRRDLNAVGLELLSDMDSKPAASSGMPVPSSGTLGSAALGVGATVGATVGASLSDDNALKLDGNEFEDVLPLRGESNGFAGVEGPFGASSNSNTGSSLGSFGSLSGNSESLSGSSSGTGSDDLSSLPILGAGALSINSGSLQDNHSGGPLVSESGPFTASRPQINGNGGLPLRDDQPVQVMGAMSGNSNDFQPVEGNQLGKFTPAPVSTSGAGALAGGVVGAAASAVRNTPAPSAINGGADIKDYLFESIFVLLCCCQPAGIAGVVLAILCRNKRNNGDFAGAASMSQYAKIVFYVGLILGLLINMGLVGLGVLEGMLEN